MSETTPDPHESLRLTERTTLRRHPERGSFDRIAAHAILDEAFVAHIGFGTGWGPMVIPTVYGRHGDILYFHGSQASRMMQTLGEGVPLCFTVTLVDGLVLARSAFYHSANYRSVVLMGCARPVTDPAEMALASRVMVDHVVAGRSAEVRPPHDKELRATAILALTIDEGSVKVRSGPPSDAPVDLTPESPHRATWAGIVPLEHSAMDPISDDHVPAGTAVPSRARFNRSRTSRERTAACGTPTST